MPIPRRATWQSGRNAACEFSAITGCCRGANVQSLPTTDRQATSIFISAFRPLCQVALLFSLILLASCGTTSTTLPTETTAVTKTLLVSQQFGRFQDAVAISTDQFGNTYVVDRGGPSIIKYSELGDSLGVISGFGRDQYQFDMPTDIEARLTNSILIAD